MPFSLLPFTILAKEAKKVIEVEARASTLVLQGLDKTKAYIMFVFFQHPHAYGVKHDLHIRVNNDRKKNYAWRYYALIWRDVHKAHNIYAPAISLGKVPPDAIGSAVIFVSPECYNSQARAYTLFFGAIGGAWTYRLSIFFGNGEYRIGKPISNPYNIEIGNLGGWFRWIKVIVFEVG